jgi:hypothetical protein
MKFIPSLPTFESDLAAKATWTRIEERFGFVDGLGLYGHPTLAVSASKKRPDLIVLGQGYAPLVVVIVRADINQITSADQDTWTVNGQMAESPVVEAEDFVASLDGIFARERKLRNTVRTKGLVALPQISKAEFVEKFGETGSQVSWLWSDADSDDPLPQLDAPLGTEEWKLATAVLQSASPLNMQAGLSRDQAEKKGLAVRQPNPAEPEEIPPWTCKVCGAMFPAVERSCPACARRQRLAWIWVAIAVALVAGSGYGIIKLRERWDPTRFAWPPLKPGAPNTISAGLVEPKIIIMAPVPAKPALPATPANDLYASRFALERQRGSDFAVAVGDVENISTNVYSDLTASMDVFNRAGAKIGTVSDSISYLGPHATWHIVAGTTDTNAVSIRFTGFKQHKSSSPNSAAL